MKLLLVRHGETAGNVARTLQGPEDPLSELGRRQARELADHLARRGDIVAMYASPLTRALDTARAIEQKTGVAPIVREALAEIDVGDAAGLTFEGWAEQFPDQARQFREDGLGYTWPGGENGWDIAARTAAETDRILEDHRREDGAVILVSHGGALAWIVARLLGEPEDRWPDDHMLLDNCSITEVDIPADPGGQATFLYRNEIGHLSPDPDAEVATGHDG